MTPLLDAKLSTEKQQVHLLVNRGKGTWKKAPAAWYLDGDKIRFSYSEMLLKDTIKSMSGSHWNRDASPPHWSIDNSGRNRFQLEFLLGGNPYEWFERPVEKHNYTRPLMQHQREASDHFLTYHYGIMAMEMGTGKSLALQEIIERSGVREVWWVGPKSSLPNIEREFRRWDLPEHIHVRLMSYEEFTELEKLSRNDPPVRMLIFDEASKLKNPVSGRSQAAQSYADRIRATFGFNGYVILATGTPSPKGPADWWSLCEIAYPGYLKEGSKKALEQRLAIYQDKKFLSGVFKQRIAWRDGGHYCAVCGEGPDGECHQDGAKKWHKYKEAKNEVAYLYDRLKGLAFIRRKKDVLSELPEKTYRIIECKPTGSVLRAAKLMADMAESAMEALMKLRELSDGFQYIEKVDGEKPCPHCKQAGVIEGHDGPITCGACNGTLVVPNVVRDTQEVACPKDAAMVDLLAENDDIGRIVIFAGFVGSVDRLVRLCQKNGWAVVRCDGRGMKAISASGEPVDEPPLDFWADSEERVAFVAHPESGGMSFTLVEARMAVYYSNIYKPEYRTQSEDRIHRKGMDENKGCVIVDLFHLPTDAKVLNTVQEDRRLETMTLGELQLALAA